jgi:hypothetical protein
MATPFGFITSCLLEYARSGHAHDQAGIPSRPAEGVLPPELGNRAAVPTAGRPNGSRIASLGKIELPGDVKSLDNKNQLSSRN